MLERMIIDISKWIVIILIFFIAFACSLFLIFSHFAVSLQQKDILSQPSLIIDIPQNLMLKSDNITNKKCPLIFFNLTTELDYYRNYYVESFDDTNDTCKNEDCFKMKRIGSYPAIYYFGRTFGSTILTTFFTLFGVIFEDNIPVNRIIIYSTKKTTFFFLLGSRL